MLHRFRFLMAPEGDGATGSTPPPAAESTTPAQGTAATSSAPTAADIAALVAAQVKIERDSIFAELRRSGALKPTEKTAVQTPPPGQNVSAAPASAVDVEALLERRENFAHALGKYDIPDSAIPRARAAFRQEAPEDVTAWASTYAADMGWKPRSQATTQTTNTNAATNVTQQPPPGAASTTAPGIVAGAPTGALLDVTRMSAAELDKLGPGGVAKAVAAVLEQGRGASGRPAVPIQANRRTTS